MDENLRIAREYLENLRHDRFQTFGKGIMFVDTDYTLSKAFAYNPVPASETMLALHNYKSRPGYSDEMRRLDIYEFIIRTATIEDIALLRALIKEKLMEN